MARAIGAASFVPISALALSIDTLLVDLPDTLAEDRWQVTYLLQDAALAADTGFTIYFDHSLYRDLAAAPAPADWDTLLIQPDGGLALPGFYDALALLDNPSVGGPFQVEFTWLGAGRPGSQPFETYAITGGRFEILESGRTGKIVVPDLGFPGFFGLAFLIQWQIWSVCKTLRRRQRFAHPQGLGLPP